MTYRIYQIHPPQVFGGFLNESGDPSEVDGAILTHITSGGKYIVGNRGAMQTYPIDPIGDEGRETGTIVLYNAEIIPEIAPLQIGERVRTEDGRIYSITAHSAGIPGAPEWLQDHIYHAEDTDGNYSLVCGWSVRRLIE